MSQSNLDTVLWESDSASSSISENYTKILIDLLQTICIESLTAWSILSSGSGRWIETDCLGGWAGEDSEAGAGPPWGGGYDLLVTTAIRWGTSVPRLPRRPGLQLLSQRNYS